MVEKIVRCPYCIDFHGKALMPMIDCFGGRFICARCKHVVMRGRETFRCGCSQCLAQETFVPNSGGIWRQAT